MATKRKSLIFMRGIILWGLMIVLLIAGVFFVQRNNYVQQHWMTPSHVKFNSAQQEKHIKNFAQEMIVPLDDDIDKNTHTELRHPISIIFGGDMMFDRYIRQVAQMQGYDFVFENLTSILRNQDLVVANLEGPITTNHSMSLHSAIGSHNNYIFTFDPEIIPTLIAQNITVVNIGNNHINNFGAPGIASTKEYLQSHNIRWFGDTHTQKEQRFVLHTINNIRLAFVNYNAFVSDARVHTLADIANVCNKADVVIVYAHWGSEYHTHSNYADRQLAYEFIDAGADVVIGSHPHVVQEHEVYHDKHIYYSLGNMIFDQYFTQNVRRGLLVQMNIDTDGKVGFAEHPICLAPNGQTNFCAEAPE